MGLVKTSFHTYVDKDPGKHDFLAQSAVSMLLRDRESIIRYGVAQKVLVVGGFTKTV